MNEEAAFLRAIVAEPESDAPRLVFADWLDEHGDPDRAEFIRLACASVNAERQAALLEANRERWLARLPRNADAWQWEFDRGLPTTLRIVNPQRFAQAPGTSRALTRASTVRFPEANHWPLAMRSVFDRPDLGAVSRVELRAGDAGSWPDADFGLARHLGQLRFLDLSGWRFGDAGLAGLFTGADTSGLVELRLADNHLSDDGAVVLASLPFPALRRLDLSHNEIGNIGATALARSLGLANLDELLLTDNAIDDAGVRELVTTPALDRLQSLHIGGNDVSADLASPGAALASVPFRVNSADPELERSPDGGIVLSRPPIVQLWLLGRRPPCVAIPAWLAWLIWPIIGLVRGLVPTFWTALAVWTFGRGWLGRPGSDAAAGAAWWLSGVAMLMGAMCGVMQCVEPVLTWLARPTSGRVGVRSLIGVGLAAGGGWWAAGEVGVLAALLGVGLAWVGVRLGVVWWGRWLWRDVRGWALLFTGVVLVLGAGCIVPALRCADRWSPRWFPNANRHRLWHAADFLALPILFGIAAGGLGGLLATLGQEDVAIIVGCGSGAFVGAMVAFLATLVVGGVLPGYSDANPDAAILDQEVYNVSVAGAGGSALAFLLAWQGGLLGLASAPWSAWLSLAGVFLASAIGASVAVGKPTHLFRQMRTAIRHRQRLWG